MKNTSDDSNKLSPITLKVAPDMHKKIRKIVERGDFKSRAEMIRQAVQNFIDDEERYS